VGRPFKMIGRKKGQNWGGVVGKPALTGGKGKRRAKQGLDGGKRGDKAEAMETL